MNEDFAWEAVRLTGFLLARITDDETNARSIENAEWFNGVDSDVEAEVLAFSDLVRVLAECAAKRRIVERHAEHQGIAPSEDWRDGCDTLRILADLYADHPDYRQEWKP